MRRRVNCSRKRKARRQGKAVQRRIYCRSAIRSKRKVNPSWIPSIHFRTSQQRTGMTSCVSRPSPNSPGGAREGLNWTVVTPVLWRPRRPRQNRKRKISPKTSLISTTPPLATIYPTREEMMSTQTPLMDFLSQKRKQEKIEVNYKIQIEKQQQEIEAAYEKLAESEAQVALYKEVIKKRSSQVGEELKQAHATTSQQFEESDYDDDDDDEDEIYRNKLPPLYYTVNGNGEVSLDPPRPPRRRPPDLSEVDKSYFVHIKTLPQSPWWRKKDRPVETQVIPPKPVEEEEDLPQSLIDDINNPAALRNPPCKRGEPICSDPLNRLSKYKTPKILPKGEHPMDPVIEALNESGFTTIPIQYRRWRAERERELTYVRLREKRLKLLHAEKVQRAMKAQQEKERAEKRTLC